jgi:hypothetical protein
MNGSCREGRRNSVQVPQVRKCVPRSRKPGEALPMVFLPGLIHPSEMQLFPQQSFRGAPGSRELTWG